MSRQSLFELRKQASFYIKEKIKSARLILTDVTPAQLVTEEATNANTWSADSRSLGLISEAAFEVDDYWRIVYILHHKLSKFDRKNWRESYNALIVLEHLLTHGPVSVAEEFQTDRFIIKNMKFFQHVDETGFNWGIAVSKKSERVLKLLEKGPLLKEERHNARKLTREIQGFGSFCVRSVSASPVPHSATTFVRSHSQFNGHGKEEKFPEKVSLDNMKRFLKEKKAARDYDCWKQDLDVKNGGLLNQEEEEEEDHPFCYGVEYSRVSLLAAAKLH